MLLAPRARVDWSVLGRALAAVVDHHDALRLRFAEQDGAWRAEHGAAPKADEFLWLRADVRVRAVTALAEEAQASLDLSSGPLLRAVGMDLSDGGQRLLVAIHHLVVDGVSWRVLLEDLAWPMGSLAPGCRCNSPPRASPMPRGGRGFVLMPEQLGGELDYWLARSSSGDLPCDRAHDGIDVSAMGRRCRWSSIRE